VIVEILNARQQRALEKIRKTRYEIRNEINNEHPTLIEECRSRKMYKLQSRD
jgi:hypothetical protein